MSSYARKLFLGTLGIYFSYISLGYLAEDLYFCWHVDSIRSSLQLMLNRTTKSLGFLRW